MQEKSNRSLFEKAVKFIPGGVNSPVRSFKSVDGYPPFIEKGHGAYLWDAEGNKYIDYVCSWGPMILGHAHPNVVDAVRTSAERGLSFGAANEAEIELAEIVIDRFPMMDKIRLVSSGTEACMTAVRLARGYTGRDIIIKFDGCYHGHSDALLVKAGSGVATAGIPGSAGIPAISIKNTISLPYNDLSVVENTFHRLGEEIAAVMVEPAAANMGLVLPGEGFLEGLRHLTAKYDSLLIFDEVITGFRIARGGACEYYGIEPDLICLGKILGGGMPIGGIAGKKDIMERLAPVGDVYQAGTLSGNPISVAAGIATLKELDKPGFYQELKSKTEVLSTGIESAFRENNIPITVNRLTGLLTVFFGSHPVTDYSSAQKCDMDMFGKFHRKMLEAGVYLPPSGYEAWFLSNAHTHIEIAGTLEALTLSLKS